MAEQALKDNCTATNPRVPEKQELEYLNKKLCKGGIVMRFITEEDLRQRFRRERFTEYEPEAGTRLTPGARQFLSDRGIRLTETENGVRPGNGQTGFGKKEAGSSLKQNEQPRETEAEERSQGAHPAEELPCWQLELGNLQADFLQAGLGSSKRGCSCFKGNL